MFASLNDYILCLDLLLKTPLENGRNISIQLWPFSSCNSVTTPFRTAEKNCMDSPLLMGFPVISITDIHGHGTVEQQQGAHDLPPARHPHQPGPWRVGRWGAVARKWPRNIWENEKIFGKSWELLGNITSSETWKIFGNIF